MKPHPPEALLRQHQLRHTAARTAVLDALQSAAHPLNAVEIHEQLPPAIDLVTVYRTLNVFLDKQIVHRARGDGADGWRYALAGTGASKTHPHPHFVCDDCGRVECLQKSNVPATLGRSLKVDTRYQVAYTEVRVHGRCPQCQAAPSAT